eukprot:s916_g26.t2
MGFTKTVQKEAPESYKPYYLKYDELKELVLDLAREEPLKRSRLMSADFMEANQPIGKFQDSLRAELKKVNQFACVKHEDVFLGLRRLCEQCKRLSAEEVQPMAERIRSLGKEIVDLDAYVRLNYMGFQMLTEKFDACLGISGSPLFVSGLHCEPFCNIRFDDILILLGLAWARWRSAQAPAEQSKDATWKPPETFIRNTSKYWVQPDKVVLLKTRIVEHLPYLIFGASQSEQEKLLEPFALLDLEYRDGMDSHAMSAYSGTMEESQLLSSVYFDSPDATSYQERIRREEGARLVRNNQEDDKEIYIERKIHHEGWGGAKSAKERCVLPQEDVFDFMKGKFDIEAYFAKLAANGTKEKTIKGMKPIAIEIMLMSLCCSRLKTVTALVTTGFDSLVGCRMADAETATCQISLAEFQRQQEVATEICESMDALKKRHREWQQAVEVLLAHINSSLNKPVTELGQDHDCRTQNDPNEVAKVQPQEAAMIPSVVLSSMTNSATHFLSGSPSESGPGGLNKLPEPDHQRGPLPELLEEVIVSQELTALQKKDQSKWAKRRRALSAFVDSVFFEYLTGIIILTNIIMIGIEAEMSLTMNEEMSWATNVEQAFLAVYTLELLLRIAGGGLQTFWSCWFLLDFFLVCVGMIAVVVAPMLTGGGTNMAGFEKLLVVRGLRLLRLARVLRMVGRFKVVWRLVSGLLTAWDTMLSATGLIMLWLFIFACVAVEIVSKDKELLNNPDTGAIVERLGDWKTS